MTFLTFLEIQKILDGRSLIISPLGVSSIMTHEQYGMENWWTHKVFRREIEKILTKQLTKQVKSGSWGNEEIGRAEEQLRLVVAGQSEPTAIQQEAIRQYFEGQKKRVQSTAIDPIQHERKILEILAGLTSQLESGQEGYMRQQIRGFLDSIEVEAFELKNWLNQRSIQDGNDRTASCSVDTIVAVWELPLVEHFKLLNEVYGYFPSFTDEVVDLFKKLYFLCAHRAKFIENSVDINPDQLIKNVYKLMVLFGLRNNNICRSIDDVCQSIDGFIKTHFGDRDRFINPVHAALEFWDLPKLNEKFLLEDLPQWQNLILLKGQMALKIFNNAIVVKEKLGHVPDGALFEDVKLAEALITYNLLNTHLDLVISGCSVRELAVVSIQHDVKENDFNRIIELLENHVLDFNDSVDTLPSCAIDVMALNLETNRKPKNYYFLKLPKKDLRAIILGNIVKSCQHIGGAAECCAIDGLMQPYNGFYVLIKTRQPLSSEELQGLYHANSDFAKEFWKNLEKNGHAIIGQSYAWMDLLGILVMDSWDNLRPEIDDCYLEDILKQFSNEIFVSRNDISALTIGTGGKTPEAFEQYPIVSSHAMRTGSPYNDSEEQYVFSVSPDLTDIRLRLSQLIFADKDYLGNDLYNVPAITAFFDSCQKNAEIWSCIKELSDRQIILLINNWDLIGALYCDKFDDKNALYCLNNSDPLLIDLLDVFLEFYRLSGLCYPLEQLSLVRNISNMLVCLADLIFDSSAFEKALLLLDEDFQSELIQAVRLRATYIIKDFDDFKRCMSALSLDNQKVQLVEALGMPAISTYIMSIKDFIKCYKLMSTPTQKADLFTTLGVEKIVRWIGDQSELEDCLSLFNERMKSKLIRAYNLLHGVIEVPLTISSAGAFHSATQASAFQHVQVAAVEHKEEALDYR